jgi:hypothetical protein
MMFIVRCSLLPVSWRGSCCYPLLSICRIVVMLVVLALAVVLALRGYAPGTIVPQVLVLVAGTVAAADRLVGAQRARAISTLPAL